MSAPHVHEVQVYYEDTDFSGVVYHANYLRYFERAREHLLGPDALVRLFRDEGIGFVVYKAELSYKGGAKHGDSLEIRTRVRVESEWRTVFDQWCVRTRAGGTDTAVDETLVTGLIQLACVDRNQKLVPTPRFVVDAIGHRWPLAE